MAERLSVESIADKARARGLQARLLARFPRASLTEATYTACYTIDARLSKSDKARAERALRNPVIDTVSWTRVLSPKRFSYAIEIGYLPGVTDNIGSTVGGMIEDARGKKFKNGERVYSSFFLFLSGHLTRSEVEAMAGELHNPLIERANLFSYATFRGGRISPTVPKVTLPPPQKTKTVSLLVPDEELMRLSREGIQNADGSRRGPLALSLPELYAIREHFKKQKRNPTDIELESLAQTWSEHCKHTIFADPLDEVTEGIYKRYIKGATKRIRKQKGKKDFCVSVFKDNSGGIAFDDEYVVTHKVETHNSPSALDPFGGALTGIGGVNRDAIGFGLGAKPIANVYGYCVGNPRDTRILYRDRTRTNPMLSPKRILEGVVAGINAGGNQSGIPTPLGFVYADDSYRGKPLVFAGTVGLIPRKNGTRELHKKSAKVGDYIVMIGGRVGLDGVHGATFSSETLSSGSPATAVQIGDPITQKKFSDAIVRELRDANLYSSITDNGAGGLSSSVAEMARDMELPRGKQGGCEVALDAVPLKYPGLSPWQIWISESQERMTLSVPKRNWARLKRILKKHEVEATRIGTFTASGSCVIRYKGETIVDLPLSFLHDGRPSQTQKSERPKRSLRKKLAYVPARKQEILSVLSRPNVGSIEFISAQYDHEVQGTSVVKPLVGRGRVNADAAVLRPVLSSPRGLVLSHGYCPSYAPYDPYQMAAGAVDIAVRNAVCAGASLEHLAILDNFCWSSSRDPKRLWELKEAARACYETAVSYGTPFISGKDSMFNDFRGFDASGKPLTISALPTLLVSAMGVMKDASRAMTMNLKRDGDLVYLLGNTRDELGGSEYLTHLKGEHRTLYGTVPRVDAKRNANLYRALSRAIEKGLVSSALGLSRGGLAVAASKMAVSGGRGMTLSLTGSTGVTLFSESQGRILVSISPEKEKAFKTALRGLPAKKIGVVGGERVLFSFPGKRISASLRELAQAYRAPFNRW